MSGAVLLQHIFHVVRLKGLLELAPGHHVLYLEKHLIEKLRKKFDKKLLLGKEGIQLFVNHHCYSILAKKLLCVGSAFEIYVWVVFYLSDGSDSTFVLPGERYGLQLLLLLI